MRTNFGVSEAVIGLDYGPDPSSDRRTGIVEAARDQGLIGAKDRTIGGRVPSALVEAAKERSNIQSDSELLLYALSKVALEDDFAAALLSLKGSVPEDIVLDV